MDLHEITKIILRDRIRILMQRLRNYTGDDQEWIADQQAAVRDILTILATTQSTARDDPA